MPTFVPIRGGFCRGWVWAETAAVGDAARDRIRDMVLGKVRTFEHGGQPRLPYARCVSGAKTTR